MNSILDVTGLHKQVSPDLSLPSAAQAWLPVLLGLLIGWMSMRLSVAIYSRQSL
ncbi:hypothetical protein [Paenibacillus popilliae]|uniref:Predicted unusual protein kinase n=1 Tax=Paenibacillus popilliae ATCC 14706 TaxID=1212764 RepID=M9LI93_PAEPP|nr:hypothetical protein [Paenibacillus popilliae]GAC42730.1 predicted unusual protein kinase [Paenibacillus popilliae ATCC 14706]